MNWRGRILPTVQQKPTNFNKLCNTILIYLNMYIVHGQRSKSNLGGFDKGKVLNETRLKVHSGAKV